MPPDQFAFQLKAYDLDNDPLTYQIEGPDAFYFSADSKSGTVTLRNYLDREVWAEDGVRCPCLSGSLELWGWRAEPVGHSLALKPSSWGESCHDRGWGSAIQGLSPTLALTKSCLVSPQLQAKLTITARVSDGVNNPVSAEARAG